MYNVEKVLPFDHSDSSKSVQVERMFDQIATGYDTMNHTMSLNMDKCWRTRGIKALADIKPQRILDVATGTGDLAIEAYMRLRPASIVGIDISEQMMNVGRTKVERLGLSDAILLRPVVRRRIVRCSNGGFRGTQFRRPRQRSV